MSLLSPIPYCCLVCAGTENCCGSCGECPICCEECNEQGIITNCSIKAYLGSDNKFYKKYTAIASAQGRSIYHQDDTDCSYRALITNTSNASLRANSEGLYDVQGQKSFESYDSCQQENACNDPYTSIVTEKNGIGEWIDHRKENCKDSEQCECIQSKMLTSEYPGTPPPVYLVDANYEDCNLCIDDQQTLDYQGVNLTNIDYFCGRGTVSFLEELKLYHGSGEEVLDPLNVLGNPVYNPCSPIQIINAPSCHFFYPPS